MTIWALLSLSGKEGVFRLTNLVESFDDRLSPRIDARAWNGLTRRRECALRKRRPDPAPTSAWLCHLARCPLVWLSHAGAFVRYSCVSDRQLAVAEGQQR